MKLSIIALTILLSACTANKQGFDTSRDINNKTKTINITIIDINEVPPVVKPPVITPSSCIKHKNKCKNKRFKGGHVNKKDKKAKKSKRH